jgi:cation transport ATPase
MRYSGKIEYAAERKIRERNTVRYRMAHMPIWIWVFFLTPGPWTFSLFAHGFNRWNLAWLLAVLAGVIVAAITGQAPGCEPRPYILRFDEDKPNPLYRKVCYTFAWNAVLNFALLNLIGLVYAVFTGQWIMDKLYQYVYFPLCALILILGASGLLPRVGRSTKNEGTERRYFYGSVWTVTIAQTLLLVLWKALPYDFAHTTTGSLVKLIVYVGALAGMGAAAWQGKLPRTRPILPGEVMVSD